MSRGRVLVLEDDIALRGLLEEALVMEDLEVLAVGSFEAMRDAAARGAADLVVADFWGDGQRSLGNTDRAQLGELIALVPVILLTGRSWAATMTAEELGVSALIRKPFDLDHLLRAIHANLEAQAG